MSYGVRIEVELFAQNRPPLSLWSLIWTGWKPRFHRFFEDFKGRKYALIVCAVSAAPFSFFENVWFRVKDAYFRELLRISKKEKWVDFCLQYRQRHYMLLKTTMYLDLHIFHNIMDWLEAQISSIFRRFQRKERCFNCLRSIDSPAFLLWKLQKKGL